MGVARSTEGEAVVDRAAQNALKRATVTSYASSAKLPTVLVCVGVAE